MHRTAALTRAPNHNRHVCVHDARASGVARYNRGVRSWRAAAIGVTAWLAVGAGVAALLAAARHAWSGSFAVTGVVLTIGAVGWVLGPFKTPMVWSEGLLLSYQRNADSPAGYRAVTVLKGLAVPAFAFAAGLLLVGISAVIAGTR